MVDTGINLNIRADARQAVAAIGSSSRAVAELRQKVEVAQVGMVKLSVAIAGAQAGLALLGAIVKGALSDLPRALLGGAVQAERMQTAFRVLTGSLERARGEIAFVRQEAYRLGIPLAEASDAWLKLAAAARGTALEGEASRRIFSAVSGAAATLGLSASETGGALLAISQMMSKGTVQAEELRGQLGERLPGAFQIAARAMGVTTERLSEMLDRGEITAADFIPRFADQLAKEIPAASDTIQQAINRMSSATEEWRWLTGSALVVAIDGMMGLKDAAGRIGQDDRITEWARKSAKAIAILIDVVRELVLFVPNVLKTIGGAIAAVARDIKLAFDVVSAAITEGVGSKGRAAMASALRERNAFIEAYNKDMADRWFPKQLATRVDEFFAGMRAKTGAAADRNGAALPQITGGTKPIKTKTGNLDAASLAAAKDEADAALAILKDGLQRQKNALDAALQDRLVSIRAYYAEKTRIEQREVDAEIARAQRMLAEQQRVARNAGTEAERIRAKAEVAKLEADLIVLNNRRADIEQANARKAAQAERELRDALAQAKEELAQITGTATDADRRAAIERGYRDLRARLLAESDTEGVAIVDKLVNVKAAQANLAALEAEWNKAQERMRVAQDAAKIAFDAGLITQAEYQQRVAQSSQEAAAALDVLIPKMEAAAKAIGPDAVIRVQAWRNEMERTRQVADEFAPLWNRIGESFGTALHDMITGAQTWRNALASLFQQLSDAFLQQLVIQPFQQWIAMQAKMLAVKAGLYQKEQAIDAAASAAKVAQKTAETTATVSMEAAKAGAGAAASQASIPYVGPELAFAAMAAMVAAVMGLLSNVKKFATGGFVSGPGTSTSDSIPARLSAGEYVVRAAAVRQVGVAFLDAINGLRIPPAWAGGRLAFAAGGLVPEVKVQPAPPQNQAVRIVNVIDPAMAADYLNSSAGEKTILNVLQRNAGAIKQVLG